MNNKKKLMCPKCPGVSLQKELNEGVEVDKCPECGGIWLDYGELKIIQRTDIEDYKKQVDEALIQQGIPREKQNEIVRRESNRYHCPSCTEKVEMYKEYFFETIYNSPVVDVCPLCFGTWLEKGELEDIEIITEKLQIINKPKLRDYIEFIVAGLKRKISL